MFALLSFQIVVTCSACDVIMSGTFFRIQKAEEWPSRLVQIIHNGGASDDEKFSVCTLTLCLP